MSRSSSIISTLTVIFAVVLVTEGNWYGKRGDENENIFLRYLEQSHTPSKQNAENILSMLLLKKLVETIKYPKLEDNTDPKPVHF